MQKIPYRKVSRKKLWGEEAISFLLWFCLSIFPFLFLDWGSFWWYFILGTLLGLYLFASLFYYPVHYRLTGYYVTQDKVFYKTGFFYVKEATLARKRLVYVSLVQTPLTPILHTMTLVVCATGATIKIRGLQAQEAKLLVKRLSPLSEV